jgi:formylglycine-generating enzyme required for sulfatase activity
VTDGERRGGGHAHDDRAVWKHRPGTSWRRPGFAAPLPLRDDHPVVHVSHNDATALCRWLTVRGRGRCRYALPSEAQWEWACRAGSGGRFWWGNELDTTGKQANVGDRALKRTHPHWPRSVMPMDDGHAFVAPVGSYAANAWGLCDMLGNVWEFCSTRSGPYPRAPATDPGDLDPKRGYAVRGGGWSNEARDCRCATRNADPPTFCHSNLGFRVMLVLP